VNLLLLVLLIAAPIFVRAQKEIKGIPSDLKNEKVIFFEYEQLPIDPAWPKMLINNYQKRNTEAEKANKMLADESKKYPFAFVISKRSEYQALSSQDYRYVLENEMMKALNNGDEMHKAFTTYHSPVYLLDLKTGDRYELFDMSQSYVYNYEWIMQKLINKLKKEFK
jgi:hypothetical protein